VALAQLYNSRITVKALQLNEVLTVVAQLFDRLDDVGQGRVLLVLRKAGRQLGLPAAAQFHMSTAVWRDSGQVSSAPSGHWRQAWLRICAAITLSPEKAVVEIEAMARIGARLIIGVRCHLPAHTEPNYKN
jgi:hypothetical protein